MVPLFMKNYCNYSFLHDEKSKIFRPNKISKNLTTAKRKWCFSYKVRTSRDSQTNPNQATPQPLRKYWMELFKRYTMNDT